MWLYNINQNECVYSYTAIIYISLYIKGDENYISYKKQSS